MRSPPRLTRSADWLAPLAFGGLFCLLGFYIHATYYPIGNVGVESDFYGHVAPAAKAISQGEFSVLDFPYRGPLHPLLLAGAHPFVQDWYRVGVILNLLCATVTLLLVYRLCLRLFDRPVAIAAMLSLSTLYPFFVDAHKATSDHLLLMLMIACVSLLASNALTRRRIFAAGVIGGLAFLTKYNGAFVVAGAGVSLLIFNTGESRWRERWLAWVTFLAGFLVISSPWFAISWIQTGQILWTRIFQNIGVAFYGQSTGSMDSAREVSALGELLLDDLPRFALRFVRNAFTHLAQDVRYLIGLVAGVLFLFGLLRLLLVRPTRGQRVLLGFGAAFSLTMALWFYLPRFFTFMAVCYYPVAFSVFRSTGQVGEEPATGPCSKVSPSVAARLCRYLDRHVWGRPRLSAILLGIALGATMSHNVIHTIRLERVNYTDRPLYVIPAAQFLRGFTRQGESLTIMSRRPHLAFLAGLEHQRYPDAAVTYEALLAFAEEREVDYLAFGIREFADHPGLACMAALDTLPGIRSIYWTEKMRIFRIPQGLDLAATAGSDEVLELRVSLKEAEMRGDLNDILSACQALAALHFRRGEHGAGAACALQGLQAVGSHHLSPSVTQQVRGLREVLALHYISLGEDEDAASALHLNLEGVRPGEMQGELAVTHELLGRLSAKAGRDQEAWAHLRAAYAGYQQRGDSVRSRSLEPLLESIRSRSAPQHTPEGNGLGR